MSVPPPALVRRPPAVPRVPSETLWGLFLNDQRALRLKWGLVISLLILAALLDTPL